LASASVDRTIRLWEIQTGQERAVLKAHTDTVYFVVFSPDGKTLASAGREYEKGAEIKLWDVNSGEQRAVVSTKGSGVPACPCFTPDGTTLVGSASERTIRLLDVRTGEVRTTLNGHLQSVTCLCYSPDGKTIASASRPVADPRGRFESFEVKLWDPRTGQE